MNKSLKPFILFVLFLVGFYTRTEAKLQAVTTPIITASGQITFCQGGSVTLTASPSSLASGECEYKPASGRRRNSLDQK